MSSFIFLILFEVKDKNQDNSLTAIRVLYFSKRTYLRIKSIFVFFSQKKSEKKEKLLIQKVFI